MHGDRRVGFVLFRRLEHYGYYKVVHIPYCPACESVPTAAELELHE
ncbi:MAG: hypothetical protein AAB417_01125 [Patescibacteria group bacterium]